jgi:flagellar motility protein MotE (MotC chaperone)
MTLPVGAMVYLASTVLFWKTPPPPPPPPAADTFPAIGPSWEFTNPEGDQLILELREEKKVLAARWQQLDEMAARLQSERMELGIVTQTVVKLQVDFDRLVVRVGEEETPNLKRLAKIYADMTPDSAALVLAQQDDAAIVKIMLFMKESETAAILEILAKLGPTEGKRAAAISAHLLLSVSHKEASK